MPGMMKSKVTVVERAWHMSLPHLQLLPSLVIKPFTILPEKILTIPSIIRYSGLKKKCCFKAKVGLVLKCVHQMVVIVVVTLDPALLSM
jgi:hypothetical protein